MELSTYFRINAKDTGQFERTLLVADEGALRQLSRGCTAPMRDENQLHAAVVELVALEGATIKYSTVQNWYPGDKQGRGGIYNFVTKRGKRWPTRRSRGTQVETGSAITWKVPKLHSAGRQLGPAQFYSVAVTNNMQQADTGTKMVHLGPETPGADRVEGHLGGPRKNTYRGLVRVGKNAVGSPTTRSVIPS